MNPEEMDYRSGMLTLNGLSKLGPITNRRLLEQFEHDPQSIFRASRDQLLSIKGVGPSMVASIKDAAHEEWICLLYTSPSPRDKRQSRMPSSA